MDNNFKRYDVVLVNFGKNTIDSEQAGTRPAVIIQNDTGNYYSKTTIVMPLSSKIKNPKDALNILKNSIIYQTYKDLYIHIQEYKDNKLNKEYIDLITNEYNNICDTKLTANKVTSTITKAQKNQSLESSLNGDFSKLNSFQNLVPRINTWKK